MHAGRFGQTFEIIAALEHADDPVVGVFPRDFHEPPGRPVEIVADEIDLRQRIAVMRVEACGNDQKVGRKLLSAGRTLSLKASRKCSLPVLGDKGALTIVFLVPVSLSAPVPG